MLMEVTLNPAAELLIIHRHILISYSNSGLKYQAGYRRR